jgi:hypothetical protein
MTTNETFQTANFKKDGIWLHYIRETGEKIFIARFKHRGTPVTNCSAFKRKLKGTSVDAYVARIEAGESPVDAAGLYEDLVEWVERRNAA